MAEFVVKKLGGIRNHPAGHPTKDEQSEGNSLADALSYAQIWKSGTIASKKTVRLDGQASAGSGGANLQIQINGAKRSSSAGTTLAGVLVDGKLRDFGASTQEKERSAIANLTRGALKSSLASKCNYAVELKS